MTEHDKLKRMLKTKEKFDLAKQQPDCGQRCELAANDTINAFARKWREIISVSYDDIANGDFSEECFSLGFGMDLGESLKKAFPGVNVEKASGFKMVVNSIDDVFFWELQSFHIGAG